MDTKQKEDIQLKAFYRGIKYAVKEFRRMLAEDIQYQRKVSHQEKYKKSCQWRIIGMQKMLNKIKAIK